MIRSESISISPNSFSMTAIRFPCLFLSIWLSNVVFPEPKNPVNSVTGIPFDFNELIYGENIRIEFIERIRSEKKFDSVEELIENIKKDVLFAKKRFSEESNL